MLFHTHVLIGILVFLIVQTIFPPLNSIALFLVVLLGSILPDIDERHSKINRWSGIIGVIIAFFFKHRGIFHSLVLHLALFTLLWKLVGFWYGAALLIGYAAHIIGDGVTRMGVPIFYPFSRMKLRGPIKVGGIVESVILLTLFVIILWIIL